MRVLHELNQLEIGGAERVVAGIIRHDKTNEHVVYAFKDGPMKAVLEAAGAKVLIDDDTKTPDLDVDLLHLHTGGQESLIAKSVMGDIETIETIHSPVVSAVRDAWVSKRVGVSKLVTAKNRKCVTIYNGVDLKRLENDYDKKQVKAMYNIPEDAFVIGRLGRLGYDKCLEEFVVACWKFQREHADKEKIYVLIAGDDAKNAKGYKGKLKVMCASMPLKNVIFVDASEDVAGVYTAMDVFMYPSPTEGFGLVYIEAMACGVPVLTWDTPLTQELLTGHAMLVKPTIDGLVNGLNAMYKNANGVRDEFGLSGQEYVLSNFSEERMSKEYQELYHSIYEKNVRPKLANV